MFASFAESDNDNPESEQTIDEAEPVDGEPRPCTSGTQKQKEVPVSPASSEDSGASMPTLETDLRS